ncbi:MAG TPA: hypothetical protein VL971_10640 [Rhizomicrobium sp.]|nr:hypothetical protein [Rhizomicrobium sp.]
MRNIRSISIAALALCAMTATGALADDTTAAPERNCATMAKQVKTALDSNQNSSNFAEASREKEFGADYCSRLMNKTGMAHYARALTLLGASAS